MHCTIEMGNFLIILQVPDDVIVDLVALLNNQIDAPDNDTPCGGCRV